ncbi:hypothetical protein CMQ_5707 [Grosmannia clavigera kw1407]|uniref:Ubiquitin 3 binding protein But2 C-terminal domain-containing protein n=1 Tax=Grosmannia clavigera (strain kw1407 / UAMH 11150) TaxID=655863 RepID=F0XSV8_GROCL|nr:uncharacterized protein CMQ_5707 [Grosmannia clavigera kw1407]EFW99286.1 hypothetical protein CMQ_5707 [Grosmannia clavigera kw1407]
MFSPKETPVSSAAYAPLALHDDGERSNSTLSLEKGSSSADEKEHSGLLTEASDDDFSALASSKPSQLALPKLILYFSVAVALLSVVNIALLPSTLAKHYAYPYSESEVQALPHGDFRLGLDRAAKLVPRPLAYHRAWPDKIARVSRKLKNSVYGNGVQVYITVEDSTILRFPIPKEGAKTCAISWTPPPELSARAKDLTTKGDITEIEVWNLIAPSVKATKDTEATVDKVDYDTLSYSTIPVRGELLGTLNLTVKPNSTTVEFACPSDTNSLVVEMTCQRVACHNTLFVMRLN